MNNDQAQTYNEELSRTTAACVNDDLISLKELAKQVKAHPTQKDAAAALVIIGRVLEDMNQRLEVLEAKAQEFEDECGECFRGGM